MMQITYMNCKNNKVQPVQRHKEIMVRLESFTAVGYRKRQLNEFRTAAIDGMSQVNTSLLKFRKYRMLLSLAYAALLLFLPGAPAFAAAGGDGGVALLKLMQVASFWVGIAVVIWGIVEAQLDLPGWKGRIFKGIGGYIGVLLVPMLFIALRDNLQIDVWSQIKK